MRLYAALAATSGDVAAAHTRLSGDIDLAAALAELERLHLVRGGHGGRRVLLSPTEAAAQVVHPREAQAHAILSETAQAREFLDRLSAVYRHPGELATSEILRTSAEVNARLHEIGRLVRRSVEAAYPSLGSPETLAASLEDDRRVIARGVERRDLHLHTTRSSPAAMRFLTGTLELGAEVRTTAVIPTRVILYDDDLAVIPVTTGDGVAAVVRDPAVVAFLHDYYDFLWDRALPVEREAADSLVHNEIEIAVLREMASGRSDEAIARRLGMSTRTLRRHLAAMTERFGVESRFQLGIVASRNGLVSDVPA